MSARYFTEHRFDLLGAGWTRVAHGIQCRGVEGIRFSAAPGVNADKSGRWLEGRVSESNLAESQRIWSLVDDGYTPIDWHLDFKSGFRWDEKTWYHDIRFADREGADVKIPWELSRMQHLPQLAIQYGVSRDQSLIAEIRNQLLDWIATNPPRFGVNWYSTMDVAIRVANMLVAYDLAVSYGANFDAEFSRIFRRSVLEHAQHIVANLEWNADFRGNHYLSNIVGLLFAAAYLDERHAEQAEWLRFCTEELITAVEEQFLEDGGNFEASTSYHRLSAEMVLYGTALLRRLAAAADPFPDWYNDRVVRMADFTRWMQKPDGLSVQIGDNDSGRFLKLQPAQTLIDCGQAKSNYRNLDGYSDLPDSAPYPDEIILDHGHLLSGFSALVALPDVQSGNRDDFERQFCSTLLGSARPVQNADTASKRVVKQTPSLGASQSRQVIQTGNAFAGRDHRAFDAFGAYIIRGTDSHLCIRCGPVGQNGIGGHAHNDQLSFELTVSGHEGWRDPGTYLYTPLPRKRNEYRSVLAHNGPRPTTGETGFLGAGLFRIIDAWEGECVEFSAETFLGVMHRRSAKIFRRITVGDSEIVVEDWAQGCTLDSSASASPKIPFSPGYGLQLR